MRFPAFFHGFLFFWFAGWVYVLIINMWALWSKTKGPKTLCISYEWPSLDFLNLDTFPNAKPEPTAEALSLGPGTRSKTVGATIELDSARVMPDEGIEATGLFAASNSVGISAVAVRDDTIVGGCSGRWGRCPRGGNEGESTIIEGNDVKEPDTVESDDWVITGIYPLCRLNWVGSAPGTVKDGASVVMDEGECNVSLDALMTWCSPCFLSSPPANVCGSFDEECKGAGEIEISEGVRVENLPDLERSALNLEVLGRLRGERCCSPCCWVTVSEGALRDSATFKAGAKVSWVLPGCIWDGAWKYCLFCPRL